jgi:hypothetical protein
MVEEIYQCHEWRFLYNEEEQLRERYKRFSVPDLMEAARKAVSARSCTSIIKYSESTHKKEFLCMMDNRRNVNARIPHDFSRVPRYTIASGVATMKFVRHKTEIPVPRIFGYSIDSNNPVGSEYILMEYIPGVPLSLVWDSLGLIGKLRLA